MVRKPIIIELDKEYVPCSICGRKRKVVVTEVMCECGGSRHLAVEYDERIE